jgi:hypothetical protein
LGGVGRAQAAKPPSTDGGGQLRLLSSLNPRPLAFINALLVLERLAEIGRVEDFFDAIDSDDVALATSLMKKAMIASTIAMAVRKVEDGDAEH